MSGSTAASAAAIVDERARIARTDDEVGGVARLAGRAPARERDLRRDADVRALARHDGDDDVGPRGAFLGRDRRRGNRGGAARRRWRGRDRPAPEASPRGASSRHAARDEVQQEARPGARVDTEPQPQDVRSTGRGRGDPSGDGRARSEPTAAQAARHERRELRAERPLLPRRRRRSSRRPAAGRPRSGHPAPGTMPPPARHPSSAPGRSEPVAPGSTPEGGRSVSLTPLGTSPPGSPAGSAPLLAINGVEGGHIRRYRGPDRTASGAC